MVDHSLLQAGRIVSSGGTQCVEAPSDPDCYAALLPMCRTRNLLEALLKLLRWRPQALVLLPLYAFCFAYWRWSRQDMVDLRFTGREQEKDGQGSPVLPVSAPQQQPDAAQHSS